MHFMLLFCKEWQRSEQRIITHAYTAMALIAVALKFAYSIPYNRINGKIMNSLTSSTQTKARVVGCRRLLILVSPSIPRECVCFTGFT